MDTFDGRISSCGFSSGDRIVVGDWQKSPLGPFTNVMWAKPDGTRVLLSPSKEHADYVSTLYNFEAVHIVQLAVTRQPRGTDIVTDSRSVSFQWKRGIGIPFSRPRWFISTIEQWIAGVVFGTKTHGTTCNGLREWYCIYNLSTIKRAEASCDGHDLGSVSKFEVDACFGFSEPPKKPSSVRLRSMIESGGNRRV